MASRSVSILVQGLLLSCLGSLGLRSLHDDAKAPEVITREPTVVIGGIGDSGTTAVTVALHRLGLVHCASRDMFSEPPWGHMGREPLIQALQKAGKGEMTRSAFLADASAFKSTKAWLLQIARLEFACAAQNFWFTQDTHDVKWGFKEPHYVWLLPVMDDIFHNRTKYLIVARDPRDTCTGKMQDQFIQYGVNLGMTDCYLWWASFWDHLLAAYEDDPRFAVVRIEDLVVPDPRRSARPKQTLRSVVQHIGMQPEWADLVKEVSVMRVSKEGPTISALYDQEGLEGSLDDSLPEGAAELERDQNHNTGGDATGDPQHVQEAAAEKQVKGFHVHNDSYMGHHNNLVRAEREALRTKVANMVDPAIVHKTMKRLGYDPMNFNLRPPTSKSVLGHD